ncbi:ketopantoate hydroxymethyltransferase [Fontibacillus sp. BL9]|uniref:ketopantoate hydroxymethyltransferase n=1 Tax=Fontibacillus sp. BL9 TaxID=3389971 RepID=UPI00397E9176
MIASSFLNGVANYTNGKIAKVVLNDSIEITNFTIKEVTESTVGMQYIVPASLVSLITKIDLKDALNNLVSTNNVYVPIASDTLLLQTITVKEV